MLARALRLFLLLEVLLYLALASYGFDASPGSAALAALLGVLSLRAALVALSYAYAWTWHSPGPRLSVAQALVMVLGEYAAFVRSFVIVFPFEGWWMGADRLQPPPAGAIGSVGAARHRRPPVLLIHGYGCSRAAWWWLRPRLEAAGWTVATLNLEPVYASIDDYIEQLARRIDAVLGETGAEKLILVGHSMGGLVARAYLQRFGGARVAGLVTLGTPHQGSRLAVLGVGENARQMRPGSPWLQHVARLPVVVETTVIYSPHDNFVMPQAHLQLSGTEACAVGEVGHLAMLYSPRVAQALLTALERHGLPRRREEHGA